MPTHHLRVLQVPPGLQDHLGLELDRTTAGVPASVKYEGARHTLQENAIVKN